MLSWSEFQMALRDPLVLQWLRTLYIEPRDLEDLFDLMDDGDGMISMDEFITGVNRMKGQAKSIDLVNLLTVVRRLQAKVDTLVPSNHVASLPFPPQYSPCQGTQT